jgi:hypothetical protein
MGFESRSAICELLDEAIANKKAEVRAIAFELNLPELLTRFEKLGSRLKIILDDSKDKGEPDEPESISAARLMKSAGRQSRAQHMVKLQHHKSIAVRGPGIHKVLYGSTNFTWRGFYVQSNNAAVVNSAKGRGRLLRGVRGLLHRQERRLRSKRPRPGHVLSRWGSPASMRRSAFRRTARPTDC